MSGGGPRYRGVRQAHAARGILIAGYLSAILWVGLGYGVHVILQAAG